MAMKQTWIKLPKKAAQALKIGEKVWVKSKDWKVNKVMRNENGYHIHLTREDFDEQEVENSLEKGLENENR